MLDAYRTTTAIYAALGLASGLDAQIILGNKGVLELRTGHLRAAATLLEGASVRERELAGDSAAVAAALGYYGRVLSLFRRDSQALAVLRGAVDMASRYAGAWSPVALQNSLFLGEAELLRGDSATARAALERLHAVALMQYGPAHVLTLRGELALASGDGAAARRNLPAIVAGLRRLGPSAEANLAEALQLLGEAQPLDAPNAEAPAALREALMLRTRSSTAGYGVALVRERLGEALAARKDTGARALLSQALSDLRSELGPDHPEVGRAQCALASL